LACVDQDAKLFHCVPSACSTLCHTCASYFWYTDWKLVDLITELLIHSLKVPFPVSTDCKWHCWTNLMETSSSLISDQKLVLSFWICCEMEAL
jgi:hypothetical protein